MKEFVPPRFLRGIEKSAIRRFFDRAPPGSINFGLGEPDLPTPDVIRRAAARVILEEQNGYTTHAGLAELRERIAAGYPEMRLTPDQVIVTAGSQEALYLLLMTLVDEGDEVLMPDPGFVAYPAIVRMAGGRPVFYRMPASAAFGFDAAEFQRKLTARTKLVIYTSPSNPTGRALSDAELRDMARALSYCGAYVLSDEIYRDIYFTEMRPSSIANYYARTFVISGLSKSLSMTGWRLGWLCGDEQVIKSTLVLHGYVTTCASTVSQKAALGAAWTAEADDARALARAIFRARRDLLLELIESELGLSAVTPDGAFYMMLNVQSHGTSFDVAEAMLDAGVITVPGSAFGEEGEGYLRVSFCAGEDRLAEGVRRMKAALNRPEAVRGIGG